MKWVQLKEMNFPVPYPSLELAELKALNRIHQVYTQKTSCFLGEVKISDRLTIILLCYYLSALAYQKNKQEKHSKSIFYLCKTEERKKELLYITDKLKLFLSTKLPSEQSSILMNKVNIFGDGETFQKMGGIRCNRLFVMPVKKYLDYQLQIRELAYWNKHMDHCMEIDPNKNNHFYKVSKTIDFLFVQTNDLESILDDVLTIQISELHIFRASLECNKLQQYYNFRFDSNKAKTIKVNRSSISQLKVDSVQVLELRETAKPQKKVQNSENKKEWRVQEYDLKFKELCKRKENSLCVRAGEYAMNNRLQIDFLQCYFLMHLQTIFYLCNYLIVEYSTSKIDDHQSSENFIKTLYKNTHLGADVVKKLRKILINLTTKHPPQIRNRELSTFYLEQVLTFFQKLVLWHDIFDPSQIQSEQNSQAFHKFVIIQQIKEITLDYYYPAKTSKEQQIKLTTFDKKILFELLTGNVSSFCCFQNFGYGYSIDYFKSSLNKTLIEDYLTPIAANGKKERKERCCLIEGLIINSTPNDEDLHLNSDKVLKKEELAEGEEKKEKESNEHYYQIIRAYGVLIHDLCEVVNDGIVVYFPNKQILKECRNEWEAKENIYERIFNKKKIFEEDDLEKINKENITQYRKLCDIGRGAVFFLSAQSPFSKFQTFYKHYSRCIVFVGVPYPHSKIQADVKFKVLSSKTHIKFPQFCFEQAMRTVIRCLSNCSNDPKEVKVILFADVQFKSNNIIGKWLTMIKDGNANTSTVIENVCEILRDVENKTKKRQQQQSQILLRNEFSMFSLT